MISAELEIVEGAQAGQRVAVQPGQTMVMGRAATADVQILDTNVSRMHCSLTLGPDGLVLVDLDSSNGTYVNGQRVHVANLLDGFVIHLGGTSLRVRLAQLAEAPVFKTCPRCGQPIDPSTILDDMAYVQSGELLCVNCAAAEAPRQAAALPEQPLEGFDIIEKLGEGNTGTVYLARHLYMSRLVALKVLNADKAENQKNVQRFLREGRSAAKLEHPHIVQVFDVGKWGDLYYIAMEYIEGITLAQRIEQTGYVEAREAFAITAQVAQALEYAHQKRIVHRDIKPHNIFLTKQGIAKLGDFGLAKSIDFSGESGITEAGTSLGTLFYMAPEQMEDALKADHRSDIYSLGATLYHMIAGCPPFTERSLYHLFNLVSTQPPPPLSNYIPGISPGAERIVGRCLAKNPAERYQTAADLLNDIAGMPTM